MSKKYNLSVSIFVFEINCNPEHMYVFFDIVLIYENHLHTRQREFSSIFDTLKYWNNARVFRRSSGILGSILIDIFFSAGAVSSDCACGPDAPVNTQSSTPSPPDIPSWCYSPNGTACSFYKTCLQVG